jgi:hypothetical protein
VRHAHLLKRRAEQYEKIARGAERSSDRERTKLVKEHAQQATVTYSDTAVAANDWYLDVRGRCWVTDDFGNESRGTDDIQCRHTK